jgi:hypothetical protein
MLARNFTLRVLIILVFIAESLLSFAQTAVPDRIVLNLTTNPGTSVAVTWRTNSTVTESFCEFQKATSTKINPAESVSVKAKTSNVKYDWGADKQIEVNQHSCILTELVSGEKYVYRVGSVAGWSEWFQIQIPNENAEQFSFIYFGDPQVDLRSQWSRVIREAYRQTPECSFMLYGGDIINRAGRDDEYEQLFDAGSFIFSMVPQVMTPGNHDYTDNGVDPHWNSQFTPPQNGPSKLKGTCYFVDYQNLRLISIDSAAGDELEDENGYEMTSQKAWLDSVLRTNTKDWVIVTTHLPFYSTKDTRDNPQLRKHFQPILEKYKVDLVLTGHDHSYGRGRASDTPNLKPSTIYVVSVSGPKIYPAGTKSWMEFKGDNKELFQKITITANNLLYQSITVGGFLFDEFRLLKKRNGQCKFIELNPLAK